MRLRCTKLALRRCRPSARVRARRERGGGVAQLLALAKFWNPLARLKRAPLLLRGPSNRFCQCPGV
eukprot:779529-Pyramimonas_sp.AAC.1